MNTARADRGSTSGSRAVLVGGVSAVVAAGASLAAATLVVRQVLGLSAGIASTVLICGGTAAMSWGASRIALPLLRRLMGGRR